MHEKMKKFNDIHEKIKFKAFGKTTIKSKPKEVKKRNLKKDVKDYEAKALYQEEVKRTDIEINEIKKMKTSKVGRVWEIKKRIVGGKKASLEATAIVNPHTGKLAFSKHQIKTVTLQYCKDTLTNNNPAKRYEGVVQTKRDNLATKISECNGSFSPTEDGFHTLIRKFKLSRKPNYNFLVSASDGFQNAVFKFFRMFRCLSPFTFGIHISLEQSV